MDDLKSAESPTKKASTRAKKPAFVTQVKLLKAELEQVNEAHATAMADAQTSIEKLTKDLERTTAAKESYYKGQEAANTQVEQVHVLLDTLAGAPARSIDVPGTYGSIDKKSIDAMTRLASYLANRVIPASAPAAPTVL